MLTALFLQRKRRHCVCRRTGDSQQNIFAQTLVWPGSAVTTRNDEVLTYTDCTTTAQQQTTEQQSRTRITEKRCRVFHDIQTRRVIIAASLVLSARLTVWTPCQDQLFSAHALDQKSVAAPRVVSATITNRQRRIMNIDARKLKSCWHESVGQIGACASPDLSQAIHNSYFPVNGGGSLSQGSLFST